MKNKEYKIEDWDGRNWNEYATKENEKPSDGFDLAKTSKCKALLIAPILALSGWIVLIYLIAKR
tara:strand:+ start:4333 stop:4524 length:192 start_codon:yes stop_codon:yes gene_type:complete